MAERKTTEQFIEEAKQVHGDRYDYSKVEYVNNISKVCIICPIHGEFWQNPHSHLAGKGCPGCYGTPKKTTEQFIKEAKLVHGDKYDYSKVEYVKRDIKVCIICPKHGEFWQKPSGHLLGQGCPACSRNKKSSTDEFIMNAKQVHGDKYDYSKVEYVNSDTKVCIICPEHGEFYQTPYNHLSGQGCPICNGSKKSKEQFIEDSKEIHGNKYDYSKVEYVNSNTKVCIICPIHGDFWQRPSGHLQGNGCPCCHESHGERKIRLFLQENNIKFESQKTFETCKKIESLPFDFYLPDYNLCIEFQGRQHTDSIEAWGGYEKLEKQQINDNIKREWCSKEENPNLLEIDYTEFNTIEEILTKNLKKNNIN